MSHSGKSDSPRSSEAREFRRAAGRRRWNSCRRCGGHRPRHSPGAHSRRPCRAIRRGSRNNRSPRRSAASSRSSSRPVARGRRGPEPPARLRSARGGGGRTAAACRRASVASSSTFGRMRRPTATTVSAASTSASGSVAATACGLFARQPKRVIARKLAFRHALVDIGRNDRVGRHPDAREEVEAARARRGEDQPHRRPQPV